VLTLAISTTPVRLVINQSVVPVVLEPSPEEQVSFRCLLIKVIFFVLIHYVIKHLSFDITLIYGHMCDLTFWTHMWCVFDFVLKIRCYKYNVMITME
jgi:hypothetical protein